MFDQTLELWQINKGLLSFFVNNVLILVPLKLSIHLAQPGLCQMVKALKTVINLMSRFLNIILHMKKIDSINLMIYFLPHKEFKLYEG